MKADMKIAKTGSDDYRMSLSPAEVRIFINCMNETINELGGWEYQTRMGAEENDIKEIIGALEAALK